MGCLVNVTLPFKFVRFAVLKVEMLLAEGTDTLLIAYINLVNICYLSMFVTYADGMLYGDRS